MENNFLTREQLLAQRRRRVPTSMGQDVLVRALGYADICSMTGALLDVAALGAEARNMNPLELVQTPKGASVLASVERVIVAGCVEPTFGNDPRKGPVPADLPAEDQLKVFVAILELSGYSKEIGEQVRPS